LEKERLKHFSRNYSSLGKTQHFEDQFDLLPQELSFESAQPVGVTTEPDELFKDNPLLDLQKLKNL
jgi:hypothetical protein